MNKKKTVHIASKKKAYGYYKDIKIVKTDTYSNNDSYKTRNIGNTAEDNNRISQIQLDNKFSINDKPLFKCIDGGRHRRYRIYINDISKEISLNNTDSLSKFIPTQTTTLTCVDGGRHRNSLDIRGNINIKILSDEQLSLKDLAGIKEQVAKRILEEGEIAEAEEGI